MRRGGAGALGRWSIMTGIICVSMPGALVAQEVSGDPPRPPASVAMRTDTASTPQRPSVPALVRYGKWVALGGAFALGFKANQSHQDANDSYQTLRDRCFEVPLSCEFTTGGRYADPVSEQLYGATRDADRRAARYLIAAEVSFAAAAAGFVWELIERQDRTPNIPFEPRVETTASETRVGVTLRF